MPVMPEHRDELCAGCGLCWIACPGGGIVRTGDGISIIETGNCDFCGICEAVCPTGALQMQLFELEEVGA